MGISEVKFGSIKDGLPYFAHIILTIERPTKSATIIFNYSGSGFASQGYIEAAPAIGYDHWKNGARAGVSFALSVAREHTVRVEINKIEGLSTDTSPTIVAYAAALAVWKALPFDPPTKVIEKAEAIVFSSWKRPGDQIPNFET